MITNTKEPTMATTKQHTMPRQVLPKNATETVAKALQHSLTDMVDLALLLKQAHWNLVGFEFRSIHKQLDKIIDDVREASDDLAERMAQIGVAPDGRSQTVAKDSKLARYPEGFVSVDDTVSRTADALATAIEGLRSGQQATADPDAVTEDIFIEHTRTMEEHLWMLQARESKA